MIWVYAFIGLLLVALLTAGLARAMICLIGFISLLAWGGIDAEQQVRYVKQRFGKDYPRKSWIKPLAIGICGWVGWLVVVAVVDTGEAIRRIPEDARYGTIREEEPITAHKPAPNLAPKPEPTPQPVKPEPPKPEPSLLVSVAELVDGYSKNEIAADEKYKGKVIEVSGVIGSIGKDITNSMFVILGTGGNFSFRYVQCFFADSEEGKLARLSKGQLVTIKGECAGLMMNVLVKGCVMSALLRQERIPPAEKEISFDLGGGVKLELVGIPAGEFLMGSPDSDKGTLDREKPQHRVRITKPFYLGKYLLTQEQWETVMGNNPSEFKKPKNPVEQVNWDDCQKFLGKLNEKCGAGRGKFQLPTEAQWEYACRAGTTTKWSFGDDVKLLGEHAWYAEPSGGKTHSVGEKKPNAWGLYDMHGNVQEWCEDWFDEGYYANSPVDDPIGPLGGSDHVSRGGNWLSPAEWSQSAFRDYDKPEYRLDHLGFRVCLVPADK
jgi:formylglycine-generating enzyme required for sulfatase activity